MLCKLIRIVFFFNFIIIISIAIFYIDFVAIIIFTNLCMFTSSQNII